jgi:hypothetical protein
MRHSTIMTNPALVLWHSLPQLSRRARRLAVIAAFTGYPLLCVGYANLVQPGRLSSTLWAPIAIVLFSATLVGVVAVYGYARNRASMEADLDERQRQVRDQAWIDAYKVLLGVVWLVIAGFTVATQVVGAPVTIDGQTLALVIPAAAVYLPLLPSATLAWSEPDLPAEPADPADR